MSSQLKPRVNTNDHVAGNDKASIELVEYGDYQCPTCGYAHSVLKNIQRELGDDLLFVFRNFPLSQIHPEAFNAAVAAEAASRQGKFWNMHDILFENQRNLNINNLFNYAQSAGLDVEQFKNDIQNNDLPAKVQDDFESGVRSGVNATPSFFINGEKFEGKWEGENLISYLKGKLASKE